MADKEEERS